jgi:hypothetical protein
MAADACSTPTGRLFITDRVSNLRFLVVTGSDLCVFPRNLVPGRKERTNYDLFAANGTPIPTYGWHTLTLNLGLRRDFTWRFVVTDVQLPIIGVDLQQPHNLHEKYQLPSVQLITPDDGHRRCPKHVEIRDKINFGYLMHLVGYLYEAYHNTRSLENKVQINIPLKSKIQRINGF